MWRTVVKSPQAKVLCRKFWKWKGIQHHFVTFHQVSLQINACSAIGQVQYPVSDRLSIDKCHTFAQAKHQCILIIVNYMREFGFYQRLSSFSRESYAHINILNLLMIRQLRHYKYDSQLLCVRNGLFRRQNIFVCIIVFLKPNTRWLRYTCCQISEYILT